MADPRSTLYPISRQILTTSWRLLLHYIVDSLAIMLAHYGIDDDLKQQLFPNVLNKFSSVDRYILSIYVHVRIFGQPFFGLF